VPQTPDGFPGIREDEGLKLIDDGYGLPGSPGEYRFSDGYFYMADDYGAFNVRTNVHPHVYSHMADGYDSFYVVSTSAPTVNEDAGDGYAVGWRWIDLTDGYEFVLIDDTIGAAIWKNTTLSGDVSVDSLWEDDPTEEGSIRPKNTQSVNMFEGRRVDGADVSLFAQTLVNNRITTATVDQAGGLNVDVHGVTGWIDGYSHDIIADSYGLALTDNSINYVYINSSAAIAAATTLPSTNYALISVIETESGAIVDQRDIFPQTRTLHYDAVVAEDGSGNYTSPEDAFAAGARTVFVKNGVYYPQGRWGPPDGGALVGESKAGVVFDFGGSTSNQIHMRAAPSDDTYYDGGGTINITVFSATVTGIGTTFQSAATPVLEGYQLIIRGAAYEVESVDSETQLTLKTVWRGETENGIAFPDYVVMPMIKNILLENFSCTNMAFDLTNPTIQFNQCLNSIITQVDVSNSVTPAGRTIEFRMCVGCMADKITSLSAGATFGVIGGWRCTIVNSMLTGAYNNGIFFPGASPGLPSIKHSVINVNIEGGNKNGINLSTSTQLCLVSNCLIRNCAQNGIIWNHAQAEHTIIGNTIRDIGLTGSAYNGISALGSGFIKDNIIKDIAYGNAIEINQSGVHVIDNYIQGTGNHGVEVSSGLGEVEISRNHIREADGYGIYLNGTPPSQGWIEYNISDGHISGHINVIPPLLSGTRVRWNDPFDDNVARDRLLLDYTPIHYTPDISPPEVDAPEQLSAHLAGIDAYLASLGDGIWWQVDPSNTELKPIVEGYGVKLYDSAGNQSAVLRRTSGNFSITVMGTDARALYKNCMREQTQLGGVTSSQYSAISDGGDSNIFRVRANHFIEADGYFRVDGYLFYADSFTDIVGVHSNFDMNNNNIINVNLVDGVDVSDHRSRHIRGGLDEIDGDILDIDYIPINYTRDTTPPQVTHVEHLTAHLAGIDGYLGNLDGYFGDGDVLGPGSSTDNAIVRFDGTTGKLIQNSLVIINDSGHILRTGATQDIGTSLSGWRNIYANIFQAGTGLSYVRLTNSGVQSFNSTLNLNGGFGWNARVTNLFGNTRANFLGNGATNYMAVRTYYGTGSGTTWSQIYHNGTDGVISTGGGLLRFDPAGDAIVLPSLVGDPTSPVDGSMWYDTDGYYRGRKDGENFTFAESFDGYQVYYVGKHGDDSNDGKNRDRAFLTFGAAIAAVNAQSPSSSNTFCIFCDDGGQYTENCSFPAWTYVRAPATVITGNHTVSDNGALEAGILICNSGVCITKTTGSGRTWVRFGIMDLTGSASGILCSNGSILVEGGYSSVVNGYVLASLTNSAVIGTLNKIEITGSGFGIAAASAGAGLNITCTDIQGSGTAIYAGAGSTLNVSAQHIDSTATAYNVLADGYLNMFVSKIVGTEINNGSARVTRAGGKFPPSATDPSSPTPAEGDTYYNTDLEMTMQYDGYRSKWLSIESETLQFGRNGTTLAGGYYRGINGIVLSATRGYPAFHDGTVVALGYTRDDSDAATFEVTANGVGFSELSSSATSGKTTSLDDDFSEDDILALRNKAGSNTTDFVQGWIKLRWRA
jgi:hypothetical protein